MFKENNKYGKGRPRNSSNKVGNSLKVVLEKLANDLHTTIDISKLKDAEKLKLFLGILPYLMARKNEIEQTNNTDLTFLDNYTEEQLEILLKNT
jgi:hypothetical protein